MKPVCRLNVELWSKAESGAKTLLIALASSKHINFRVYLCQQKLDPNWAREEGAGFLINRFFGELEFL